MRTLYVGGLHPETTASGLEALFAAHGQVCEARVVMRPSTGRCRGFGYVTFESPSDARRARAALDGKELDGARLRVDLAR